MPNGIREHSYAAANHCARNNPEPPACPACSPTYLLPHCSSTPAPTPCPVLTLLTLTAVPSLVALLVLGTLALVFPAQSTPLGIAAVFTALTLVYARVARMLVSVQYDI